MSCGVPAISSTGSYSGKCAETPSRQPPALPSERPTILNIGLGKNRLALLFAWSQRQDVNSHLESEELHPGPLPCLDEMVHRWSRHQFPCVAPDAPANGT